MKYKIGDMVVYSGGQDRYKGKTGTIITTKEHRTLENDISRGGTVSYPKDGYDYTIRLTRYESISMVLDVLEDKIVFL